MRSRIDAILERSLTLAGLATTILLSDGRLLACTCPPSRLYGRLKLAELSQMI